MSESVTVVEAAKRLGVARNTIYEWEKSGRLKRRADGLVSVREIERLTSDWRAELDTAKAGTMAVAYMGHWYKAEVAKRLDALVDACRQVAAARGEQDTAAAIAAVRVAVDRDRAMVEVGDVVREASAAAAQLASDAMRHAREAVK